MLEGLMSKVHEVDEDHKKSEKTLMNHDLSRFASSNPSSPDTSPSKGEGGGAELNCSGANFALKHSELANQLTELNKMLVAKQELASKMGESDEKMTTMRRNYETTIKSMEEEITRLQKEKDELCQKQKAEASSQISENRRKRIQELEEKIKNLGKQQAEQQRLLKLNKQNELKIKKYSEEITQMKQTKVKLIKQMKEESEGEGSIQAAAAGEEGSSQDERHVSSTRAAGKRVEEEDGGGYGFIQEAQGCLSQEERRSQVEGEEPQQLDWVRGACPRLDQQRGGRSGVRQGGGDVEGAAHQGEEGDGRGAEQAQARAKENPLRPGAERRAGQERRAAVRAGSAECPDLRPSAANTRLRERQG